MPVRIAVEGFDGSGKTTLIDTLRALGAREGVSVDVIGRRGLSANRTITRMTKQILEWDANPGNVPESVNASVRLARVLERSRHADSSVADVVLFDRWIPADLSRLNPDEAARRNNQFLNAHAAASIDETLYLNASFRTVWARIISRPKELWSPSELLGEQFMSGYYGRYQYVWDKLWFASRREICGELDRREIADLAWSEIQKHLCRDPRSGGISSTGSP